MKPLFFPAVALSLTWLSHTAYAQPPLGVDAVAFVSDEAPQGFNASFASADKLILLNGETYDLHETSIDIETDDPDAMGKLSAFQRFTINPAFSIGAGGDEQCSNGAKVFTASTFDDSPGLVHLDFFEGFDTAEQIGSAAQPCFEILLVPAVARVMDDGNLASSSSASGEDSEAQEEDVATAPAEEDIPSKWFKRVATNPMDDTKTVTLHLVADQGTARFGDKVSMVARCQSNKTELYIDWKSYLGDDSSSIYEDWKYVTVRLGEQKAERQRWSVSTDSKATFAPNWPGNLLKNMLEVDQVVFQTTPYNESPVTAIFDVRGLRKDLQELAETCSWSF